MLARSLFGAAPLAPRRLASRARRLSTAADEWSWEWKAAGAAATVALCPAAGSVMICCCDGDSRSSIEACFPAAVELVRNNFGPFRGEDPKRLADVRRMLEERARPVTVSVRTDSEVLSVDAIRLDDKLDVPTRVSLHAHFSDVPAEDGALAVTAGTPDVAPPLTVDSARRSLWSDYDARACAKPWFASLSGKRK